MVPVLVLLNNPGKDCKLLDIVPALFSNKLPTPVNPEYKDEELWALAIVPDKEESCPPRLITFCWDFLC